jgi:hypothetical protein
MKELQPGITTNKELAEWFGIKEVTFRNKKQEKLELLKDYCDFEELPDGKINITYVETAGLKYEKKKSKNMELINKKVEEYTLGSKTKCSKGTTMLKRMKEDKAFSSQLTIAESTQLSYIYISMKEQWGIAKTARKVGTIGRLGTREKVLCFYNGEEWEPVSDADLEFFYSCRKEQSLQEKKEEVEVVSQYAAGKICKDEANKLLNAADKKLVEYFYALEKLSERLDGKPVDWAMKCERAVWEEFCSQQLKGS